MTGAPRGRNTSLSSILGKEDKAKDKDVDTSSASTSTNKAEDEAVVTNDPVTLEDVQASLKDGDHKGPNPEDEGKDGGAPGAGIISETDVKEDDKPRNRRDIALDDVGVLSRVHKMSPPNATHLNFYSGGEDRVSHGEVKVEIKPLPETEVVRERTIVSETGKSRLLHPDVTDPYVPSEQGRVMSTSYEYVYATPYDPNNDPNR